MNKFIIGIDPGLNNTGLCILNYVNNNYNIVFLEEIITNNKNSINFRLFEIYEKIDNILKKFPHVTIMGLEESFVNINNKSSLKLGMVSGVILMLSAKYNLELKYMSPTYIKKKISGNGSATKEYIELFVKAIIPNVKEDISHHLYDAIAIAIVCG
jgi:crossover junction endodeoxyribonuclease RuvC